jgi:hypothetical protein
MWLKRDLSDLGIKKTVRISDFFFTGSAHLDPFLPQVYMLVKALPVSYHMARASLIYTLPLPILIYKSMFISLPRGDGNSPQSRQGGKGHAGEGD